MTAAEVRVARTVALTALTMVAFAANSILCRLALQPGAIDPASFTAARLLSGALALAIIARSLQRRGGSHAGSWTSAFLLFLYALPFSLA